jgi:hypothetical protein
MDSMGGSKFEKFEKGHWWGVQHMLFNQSVWHRDVKSHNCFCELHYLERSAMDDTMTVYEGVLTQTKKRIRSLYWRQFCKFTVKNADRVRQFLAYYQRLQSKQFTKISTIITEDYTKTMTKILFDARNHTKSQFDQWNLVATVRTSLFTFTDEICDILNSFKEEEEVKAMQSSIQDNQRLSDDVDNHAVQMLCESDLSVLVEQSQEDDISEFSMDCGSMGFSMGRNSMGHSRSDSETTRDNSIFKTRTLPLRQSGTAKRMKVTSALSQIRSARSRQESLSSRSSTTGRRKNHAASMLLKKAKMQLEGNRKKVSKRSISPGLQRLQQDAAARGRFEKRKEKLKK